MVVTVKLADSYIANCTLKLFSSFLKQFGCTSKTIKNITPFNLVIMLPNNIIQNG